MTAPDFMPVLGAGAHSSPAEGACVMEMCSLLAGETWSDSPTCTHPVLAAMARKVNDMLPNSKRHQLVPLIGRLFGTAPTGTDQEQHVLSVRLAVWCARQMLPLVREQDRQVCAASINAAEGWCNGTVTREQANAAADAAYAAAYAAADAAYAAAYAAADAAYAAAYADADADADADLVALLTGLLDEYDRLTGRTVSRALSTADYTALTAATR